MILPSVFCSRPALNSSILIVFTCFFASPTILETAGG